MPGAESVHVRFYVKFSSSYQYSHHFVWLLANPTNDRWRAFGKAGKKPDGSYFSTGMEPSFARGKNPPPGEVCLYAYYPDMAIDPKRSLYWGNQFLPPGPSEGASASSDRIVPALDRWQRWEFMMQANSAPEASDPILKQSLRKPSLTNFKVSSEISKIDLWVLGLSSNNRSRRHIGSIFNITGFILATEGLREMVRSYQVGDWVVFAQRKQSPTPGPRAKSINPSKHGELYSYQVDKFWVVAETRNEHELVLITRRGKTHFLNSSDVRLRKARWWERLFLKERFPRLLDAPTQNSVSAHPRN